MGPGLEIAREARPGRWCDPVQTPHPIDGAAGDLLMTKKWDPTRRELLSEGAGILLAVGTIFGIPAGVFWYEGSRTQGESKYFKLIGENPQTDKGYWEPDTIVVTEGDEVTLELHSGDVVHSFYLPAFDLNVELYPGVPQTVAFVADEPGKHEFSCDVKCGGAHITMVGNLFVEASS